MAYTAIGWKDYPDTTTPVNADNLNKMDEQILENTTNIGNVSKNSSLGATLTAQITALNNNKSPLAGSSSLTTCSKGTFGTACTKGTATKVAEDSTGLVTSGAVYDAISTIGTKVTITAASASSSKSGWRGLGYITLSKGVWIIKGNASFSGVSNSVKYGACISATSGAGNSNNQVVGYGLQNCAAISLYTVSDSSKDLYLNAYSSSECTASVGDLTAVRII